MPVYDPVPVWRLVASVIVGAVLLMALAVACAPAAKVSADTKNAEILVTPIAVYRDTVNNNAIREYRLGGLVCLTSHVQDGHTISCVRVP